MKYIATVKISGRNSMLGPVFQQISILQKVLSEVRNIK